MTVKLISLVASSLAISFATQPTGSQAKGASDFSQRFSVLANIQLTPQQQIKLHNIHQQMRSELEQILTREQQSCFRENIERGGNLNTAMSAMDLSISQRRQIRDVFQATQIALVTLISVEQALQLVQNLRLCWSQALRVKPKTFSLQTFF